MRSASSRVSVKWCSSTGDWSVEGVIGLVLSLPISVMLGSSSAVWAIRSACLSSTGMPMVAMSAKVNKAVRCPPKSAS